MLKQIKKAVAFALVLCLSLAIIPTAVLSAETEESTDKKFSITYAESENGKIEGDSEAAKGDTVKVKVTPNEGFYLVKLTCDNEKVEFNDKNEFTMPKSKVTISAEFAICEYEIKVPTGTGFKLQPVAESSSPVAHGGNFYFQILLDEKYDESEVTVKVNGVTLKPENGIYTIKNIKEDKTITLEGIKENGSDTPKTYNIWTRANEGGSVYPSNAVVKEGEGQTFFFTPQTGYKVKNVYIDLIPVGAVSFYVFNDVKANHAISVEFEKIEEAPVTFTVTFRGYDGRLLKTEEVEQGKDATAPEVPAVEGYTFTGWDKEFKNVQANLTVNAVYEEIPADKPTKLFLYVKGSESSASDLIVNTHKVSDKITLNVKSNLGAVTEKITWSSSNKDVALVSSDGTVAVIGYGTATITATYEGLTAKYVVISLASTDVNKPVTNPDTSDD